MLLCWFPQVSNSFALPRFKHAYSLASDSFCNYINFGGNLINCESSECQGNAMQIGIEGLSTC